MRRNAKILTSNVAQELAWVDLNDCWKLIGVWAAWDDSISHKTVVVG